MSHPKSGSYFRMRHLCLAVDDIERIKRDVPAIFGVELGYIDKLAIDDFQVHNAVFPFGDAVVEFIMPTNEAAPSSRFLKSTGGRGGYLLGFNCSDPKRRAEHLNAMGVRTAAQANYEGFACWQMHPRDCRAAMIEFDETEGGASVDGPVFAIGGMDWRQRIRTDVTRRVIDAVLESPDPRDLAAHWSRMLELPWVAEGEDGARIDMSMMPLRFRRAPAGVTRESFAAITLEVVDPTPMLAEAKKRGCEVDGSSLRIGGVAFELRPA